ncbi:hypothetical protein JOF55_001790 [Haloactinomyces albus]|uniref:Short chain dehydrogenase n=1 Tax=Haloactinomyces albus TaxID=1352928 RepID=A0AAE3ZDL6_9ACTN|nr:hypothetical protein [Haloactinomyces albus]
MAGKLDIDDLDHDWHFTPVRAYSAAKLENILFTKELHRRYHSRGIASAAFHPGNVATRFGTQSESRLMRFVTTNRITRAMLIPPEKGADQLVWLAESRPGVDWESGAYYEKRRPAKRISPQTRDIELARRLWNRSEELLADGKCESGCTVIVIAVSGKVRAGPDRQWSWCLRGPDCANRAYQDPWTGARRGG